MALHHKLCHTLGGTWNLPHAERTRSCCRTRGRYNRDAAPEAMARIARALGGGSGGDAALGVQQLARRHGAPTSLAAIGMPADGLDRVADLAASTPYPNPRPLERTALRALLQRAYDGAPPRA